MGLVLANGLALLAATLADARAEAAASPSTSSGSKAKMSGVRRLSTERGTLLTMGVAMGVSVAMGRCSTSPASDGGAEESLLKLRETSKASDLRADETTRLVRTGTTRSAICHNVQVGKSFRKVSRRTLGCASLPIAYEECVPGWAEPTRRLELR